MAIGPVSSTAVLTPEQREARRIAANTPPPGTSIVGPTADGDPLAFGTGNTFNVGQGQEVRVVDAGGNVIFSGAGAEGANRAVAVAQSLSDELGGNANFKIQTGERTINPDGSVGGTRYIDVARAAPSQSGLGFLADYVLPFAASFIPGVGPVLGAALGSGASSAAQGRSLQDTLTRAAMAAGGSYLGGQVFGPATPGASTPTDLINSDLIPNALQGLNFGSIASTAIPAGVGGAVGDIIVNAAPSIFGSAFGSAVGSTVPSLVGTLPSIPDEIVVTGTRPTEVNLGEVLGALTPTIPFTPTTPLTPTTPPSVTDEIVVTGTRPTEVNLGEVLGALTPTIPFTPTTPLTPTTPPSVTDEIVVTGTRPTEVNLGGVLGGLTPTLVPTNITPVLNDNPPTPEKDEIVVTGTRPTNVNLGGVLGGLTPTLIPTDIAPVLNDNPPTPEKDGVLGTGLTLAQLLSIGGIGADLLKSLLGGGGGAGAGVPYVSPFGPGVGIGAGRDMRANPNITDYERYGFGPEAMFFQPGYGLLNSAAPAPALPQAQPIMATNPRYEPLI